MAGSAQSEIQTIEKDVKAIVDKLGSVTTKPSPTGTVAEPTDRTNWTFGSIITQMPDWDFLDYGDDGELTALAADIDRLSALKFSNVTFTVAYKTATVAAFSGIIERKALADLNSDLAEVLAKVADDKLTFTGTVEPNSDDYPSMDLSAVLKGELAFTDQMCLRNLSLKLKCSGSKAKGDGASTLMLLGDLHGLKNGSFDDAKVISIEARMRSGGWRFHAQAEESETPATGTPQGAPATALSKLLGLLPLKSISGAATLFDGNSELATAVNGAIGKTNKKLSVLDDVELRAVTLIVVRPKAGDPWEVPLVSVTVRGNVSVELPVKSLALALTKPTLTLEVDAPSGIKGVLVEVGGTLQIGKPAGDIKPIELNLSASFSKARLKPRLRAFLWQPPKVGGEFDKQNSLSNIVKVFGGDVPKELDKLFVEELNLTVDTADWVMSFDAGIRGELSIPVGNLKILSGSFNLERDKPDENGLAVWHAGLQAEISLNAKVGPVLTLGGRYETGKAIILKGELKPISKKKPITINSLVKIFDDQFEVTGPAQIDFDIEAEG